MSYMFTKDILNAYSIISLAIDMILEQNTKVAFKHLRIKLNFQMTVVILQRKGEY